MTLRNNILLAAIRKISWRHQNRIARLNRLIRHANLFDADLSYANLIDANLSHANLCYADLSYAWMRETKFSYSNLSGVKGIKYAQLSTHHHGEMGRPLTAVEQQGQLTIHCGCFNSFEDAAQELRQYLANGDEELKASRPFHLDRLLARSLAQIQKDSYIHPAANLP